MGEGRPSPSGVVGRGTVDTGQARGGKVTQETRQGFRASLRAFVDRVGIDPYDIDPERVRAFVRAHESDPVSRFWFGSPCRFVRRIDLACHVILPEMLEERHPVWACYLRTTSPRWGRAWRGWAEQGRE